MHFFLPLSQKSIIQLSQDFLPQVQLGSYIDRTVDKQLLKIQEK